MVVFDLLADAAIGSVLRSPLVKRAYGIWRLKKAIERWEEQGGEISIEHRLPGRLRLRIRRLRENPALAQHLEKELAQLVGVTSVRASAITGGLLVVFEDLPESSVTRRISEVMSPQKTTDNWSLPPDLNAYQTTVVAEGPSWFRFHAPLITYLGETRERLGELLESQVGVNRVALHPPTSTVFLSYDELKLSAQEVRESLPNWLLAAVSRVEHRTQDAPPAQTSLERSMTGRSSQEKFIDIVLSSLTLVASAWSRGKRYNVPSGPARLFTGPAMTSLFLGIPVFKNGLSGLRRKKVNADTLTTMAILSSIVLGKDLSALVVLLLADIGELVTTYSAERTREAITSMLSVGEPYVWKLDEHGVESRVPLEDLVSGDTLVVHIGEKISVDGVVLSGEASVDQASITGEFMPMLKEAGDTVFAGTVLTRGRLVVRAHAVGDSTAVARIIHLVEEASQRKAPIQLFADKFSQQLVPLSFVMAALVYLITRDVNRALNLLIIDYSCGVRLSTATAFSSSIFNCARQGILIKGGSYLEVLSGIDTLVLDKTGTVTEGRPRVASVVPCQATGEGTFSEKEVLIWAASAEQHAPHPLADAVMSYVEEHGWEIPRLISEEIVVAQGVQAIAEGREVLVGSRRFLLEKQVTIGKADDFAGRMYQDGQLVLFVAVDRKLVGLIGVRDPVRGDMKKALNRLRRLSIDDLILLTGDVESSAEQVATQLTVDRYRANVLPEDKADMVRNLQAKGVMVAMVGEGVNDAPALACADVGIVMGSRGTDLAIETADVTLAGDDPMKIPDLLQVSRQTMNTVRQNFGVVIGLNTVAIILGAMGVITPMTSAVIHNLTTVGVVLNSTRLLVYRPQWPEYRGRRG